MGEIIDVESDLKPKWAPLKEGPVPSFPLIAFAYKSQVRAMMRAGDATLCYQNQYQEPVHRNDFPYDVYGRVRTMDHELIIDDIDMSGNAMNRALMVLALETQFNRVFFFHVTEDAGLLLVLKSAANTGYEGVICRPFEAKFGDAEYRLSIQDSTKTTIEIDSPSS